MKTLLMAAVAAFAPGATQDRDGIDELVRQLRDDDIEVRSRAEDALAAKDEAIVPELRRRAALETDPDVRERLGRAVRRIEELPWQSDLEAALKRAAESGRRVLVLSAPSAVDGPN